MLRDLLVVTVWREPVLRFLQCAPEFVWWSDVYSLCSVFACPGTICFQSCCSMGKCLLIQSLPKPAQALLILYASETRRGLRIMVAPIKIEMSISILVRHS